MTPEQAVLLAANAAGLRVTADGDCLIVTPSNRINAALRELLTEFKPGVLALVMEAQHLTYPLIEAAMRACDHHNDSETARAAMRAACHLTPAHLRLGLLQTLLAAYPVASRTNNGVGAGGWVKSLAVTGWKPPLIQSFAKAGQKS